MSGRRRVVIVVCDGLGVGAAPDAEAYGDGGATRSARSRAASRAPAEPRRLGLLDLIASAARPARGERLSELSAGKDTTTGHWEMMGLTVERPFPLYPEGFPPEVVEPFEAHIGKEGPRQQGGLRDRDPRGARRRAPRDGPPILYTSGDSVFQVAAHEDVFAARRAVGPLPVRARVRLPGRTSVGRVIARPFSGRPRQLRADGEPPRLHRRANRRDVARPPGRRGAPRVRRRQDRRHLLRPRDHGVGPHRIGRRRHPDHDRQARSGRWDVVFTNLVDFDSKYGHRNDPAGFATDLGALDARIPELLGALGPDDLFLLTADHGCETTDVSTDHTREYVPLLAAGAGSCATSTRSRRAKGILRPLGHGGRVPRRGGSARRKRARALLLA